MARVKRAALERHKQSDENELNPLVRVADLWNQPDYQRDVYRWAAQKLDLYLWSLPQEIALLTQAHKRVAVPACHSSSKSHTAAVLACHHIDTHSAGEARVITTAPSSAQMQGVLWGEINKMFDKAVELGNPFPGRVNLTNWWIDNWQAGIGRKPSDYKPEQFAGFHARYPFIILDEADGLPDTMWDGVESLMSSRNAKMLAIANPLDPGSRFAKVLELDEWAVLRIPYHQTPNFTDEDVPDMLLEMLIDADWVERRRLEWGGERAREDPTFQPDHPFWYGRVLAQHPPQSQFVLMRVADVEACMEPNDDPVVGIRQLGLDVAGSEKGDKTVARERVGRHILRRWELQSSDDDAVEQFAIDCARMASAEIVCLDATGMGFGFTGRLRRRLPGVAIIPVNFGASSDVTHEDGSRKFANLRAELWVRGKDLSESRGWDLSRAEGKESLEFELVAPRYKPDVLSGKRVYQVESKDDVRRRIGRSPDDADATLLAVHASRSGGRMRVQSGSRHSVPTGAAAIVRPR